MTVRRSRLLLVVLFVALQVFAALSLVMVSVHGPTGLPIVAFAYVVVAPLATLFANRRIANPALFAGVGLALLGLVPALFGLTAALEEFGTKRRIARTRVTDVHDEPIVSATGRPIGIRISYNVTVPGRGYFAILPTLSVREPRNGNGMLHATRWTIDGRRDAVPFEPGKTHSMVVELYPPILVFPRGERCLAQRTVALPDSAAPAPLRIAISDTPYGNVYRGESEQFTRGSYDLAQLYEGVLAEGLPRCNEP